MGQKFVKETLKKAIAQDKTVGAYLLCGPRGTGKTTTARLLAKTINCLNSKDGNPCLECNICTSFLEERLVDIIEIDAASHTGVDNIREIIERAQFAPTQTKFKIYIIDEVHMLSKGAFNALLKILEEPPSHVKFILATTETHKVPETIISRCQRYDFKRINNEDIKERLSYVAEKEDVKIDDKSYSYIIKNSGGGLRNALSLFEQLIEDNEINFDRVIQKMGVVGDDILKNFLDKLVNKDTSITQDFDELVGDGKNIKLFFKELLFFAKQEALDELKSGNNIDSYINILDVLDHTYAQTKNTLDESTTFLIGILKIVTGYSPVVTEASQAQQTPTSHSTTKQVPKTTQEPVVNKQSVQETKQAVSSDDAFDVFGDAPIVKDPTQETVSNDFGGSPDSGSTPFNVDNFISKLKTKGAKGGLTMALRGSSLSLNGDTLNVGVKTKIAKGQMIDSDNNNLMLQVLADLGISDGNINVVT